jgi:hypothetical protein
VIEILLSKEPKICVMLHFQKKPILGANLGARKKLYVAVSAAKIYYFPFLQQNLAIWLKGLRNL